MIGSNGLRDRLLLVADTLGLELGQVPGAGLGQRPKTLAAATDALATALPAPTHKTAYLLLAVVTGRIPTPENVVALDRCWRLSGAADALGFVLSAARSAERFSPGRAPNIRIARGILVDVQDTAHSPFTTGIQRVTRSVLGPWAERADLELVCWTSDFQVPRALDAAETEVALGHPSDPAVPAGAPEVVVPYECTWLLPEIAVDIRRATRTHTIAMYSGSRTGAIGYDCIPITTAETAARGMAAGFANYLAALAAFDVVSPISFASGAEFNGWRGMLAGGGLLGPTIHPVQLATANETGDPSRDVELLAGLGIDPQATIVLAVGSHEPRKNHVALLQSCELAWRAGLEFTLVMVGGRSWDRDDFDAAIAAARDRGRKILLLTGTPDDQVWALYRRARFSAFPSFNEGFGLPVVESICVGTPVITSDFGSMREIGDGVGALLVDPRDDASITAAITRLLTDDVALDTLRKQTARAPMRSWTEYAGEVWAAFGLGT